MLDESELQEYWSEMTRAMNETGDDHDRCFCSMFIGDADGGVAPMQVERGEPERIKEQWEYLVNDREDEHKPLEGDTEEDDKYWKEQISQINESIRERKERLAVLENCFFVFFDDCGMPDVPHKDHGISMSEWNLLYNKNPADPVYKAIWDRKRLTYQQACDKVGAMTVKPPPPDQKYYWYDRTE